METAFGPSGPDTFSWISVGDPIKIDQRDIYTVARVSVLRGHECILGCSISPAALLITEPERAYAISLTEEEITVDQLLAMAPSIKEIVGNQKKRT
jgi:uncharacterized spore protein YtfJ